MWIAVCDKVSGERLSERVRPDRALDAFKHPFAPTYSGEGSAYGSVNALPDAVALPEAADEEDGLRGALARLKPNVDDDGAAPDTCAALELRGRPPLDVRSGTAPPAPAPRAARPPQRPTS
jgi:hypothetical protein